VEVKEVHASMGGQPVTLSGKVELPDGKEPRLDLALRGEKLPFVRQAGLLVRGDLDLRIVTDDNAVTRITGATRLRESLFLMDVRALLPSGGARNAPGRRPPYFVVEAPPFDEWQLDVTVDGDRFLRLRTPVFAGLASAHFRLRGTLGDPRATGEAVINQGQVLFPFATFAVRQGEVRLTEANPFEPTISLMGTSRRYGYDLRMEMSGTVEKPLLTFSSTPALESEQVLLMVMAGEAPQNEVTYTGRQRAARLGTYLGQSLLGQLGADPSGSERLSVTVGERVSRRGRETYGVEYELTPRWSLVGEYDEFDDYNVGVKWRVFSEKKAEEEANAQKK
jgi:translocation and assembly module TamB